MGKTKMNKLTKMTEKLDKAMLIECATKLYTDYRDGANVSFVAVLNALEKKVPEFCFVAFCESL